MPDPIVTEEQVLDALRQISPAQWSSVLGFIHSLGPSTPPVTSTAPISTLGDILDSGLVGLWADRTDLGEGHAFARRIRREASLRRHPRPDDHPAQLTAARPRTIP